jgi:hypothetical protein
MAREPRESGENVKKRDQPQSESLTRRAERYIRHGGLVLTKVGTGRTEDKKRAEAAMQADIDRILARLDTEIPEAMKEMDALLTRLRTTRIVVAA